MAKKPAATLEAVTMKKGNGEPAAGAPQREAPARPAPKAKAHPSEKGGNLVPLNFRVPEDFKEEFQTYAFMSRPRRKMVDLLKDAFAALKEKEGTE